LNDKLHNDHPVNKCSAIILAAGQSSRLGIPKQLLHHHGKTLLQHTIDVAKQASLQPIIVVLGANYEQLAKEIDMTGIHAVRNDDWHTGIASSICCGINNLLEIDPSSNAAILMVCDQPHINASLLHDLQNTQKSTGKMIVASKYADTNGIPALFHKNLFDILLKLSGDTGAKKIMQQYPHLLTTVPFPLGSIDIDTLEDYEMLGE
jgi:molybdenum cofactor cytidylyltransferase